MGVNGWFADSFIPTGLVWGFLREIVRIRMGPILAFEDDEKSEARFLSFVLADFWRSGTLLGP
jgi:hypothetical protein